MDYQIPIQIAGDMRITLPLISWRVHIEDRVIIVGDSKRLAFSYVAAETAFCYPTNALDWVPVSSEKGA